MKTIHQQFKQRGLLAGALISLGPLALSPATIPIPAQAAQSSYQTYQSQRLNFKIAYPASYRLDASAENRGYLQLQPKAANQAGRIVMNELSNPDQLSALEWVRQRAAESNFTNRQDDPKRYTFAGQPAVSYPWCAKVCGDNVVFPSRDRQKMMVLTVLYDYPSDQIRWDFQNMIGKFRFTPQRDVKLKV